jgi:uncharacterized protein (TIGR00255 family)
MFSMTGYGKGVARVGGRSYALELRSYNNRFLDVKVRLPWPSKELDSMMDAAVRKRVHRGRVEVSVWEEGGTGGEGRLVLDENLARGLSGVLGRLAEILGSDLQTAAGLVAPLRELVVDDTAAQRDAARIWEQLEPGLQQGLDRLVQMREREGAAIRQDLEGHLAEVETIGGRIRELARDEPELHRTRLVARLQGMDAQVEPERLAQEIALFADRCDVSEELARLESHADQLRGTLGQDGPVGRKMEFLLQEFNRELNTIASKTQRAEIAHLVVEAKACLERMREQTQNVE